MGNEKEITRRIKETGYPRLKVIGSMNLGPRSLAAQRALQHRERRAELMYLGMDFATACLVVNQENERALPSER